MGICISRGQFPAPLARGQSILRGAREYEVVAFVRQRVAAGAVSKLLIASSW